MHVFLTIVFFCLWKKDLWFHHFHSMYLVPVYLIRILALYHSEQRNDRKRMFNITRRNMKVVVVDETCDSKLEETNKLL